MRKLCIHGEKELSPAGEVIKMIEPAAEMV